jgi:hypothetical protein
MNGGETDIGKAIERADEAKDVEQREDSSPTELVATLELENSIITRQWD